MPRKKSKPVKNIKPIDNDNTPNAPISFNILKMNEDSKKIKPEQVFEGYKKKK